MREHATAIVKKSWQTAAAITPTVANRFNGMNCQFRWMFVALCLGAATACSSDAQKCTASYGDVIEFDRCNPVSLPDVKISEVGASQPVKNIPLLCRNYEASIGSEKTTFYQCTTGDIGGEKDFVVAGKSFTVVFDVATRHPGRWGQAFYAKTNWYNVGLLMIMSGVGISICLLIFKFRRSQTRADQGANKTCI